MNNALSKLQIGLTAYYDGELYDEETGNLIPENVSKLGLSLDDIDLCMQWLEAYQDYHANDTVRYGCGVSNLDLDYEGELDDKILKRMKSIEKILGGYNHD